MSLLQIEQLMTLALLMIASEVVRWIPDPYDVRRRESNRRTIPGDASRRQNQPSSYWDNDLQTATLQLMPDTSARTGTR